MTTQQGRREKRGPGEKISRAKRAQNVATSRRGNLIGSAFVYARIEESVTDDSTQASTHWVQTMQ